MRRPNHVWDVMLRAYVYPSGEISATEQMLYASAEAMREWCAVALCAALAWMKSDARYWT